MELFYYVKIAMIYEAQTTASLVDVLRESTTAIRSLQDVIWSFLVNRVEYGND